MLDKSNLPHAITSWNYLNVLGAWELSSDKNESSEQRQFLVKRLKSCLTWVNCILRALPLHPCLWIWLLTVREQSCRLEKKPWIGLNIVFETTSFFLYFSLFNIIINSITNQWIKCSAVRRREGLGELGIALLHVIKVGYNTLHRCPAENTKRFWLASLSRSSNLRIKLWRETVWQTDTYPKTWL